MIRLIALISLLSVSSSELEAQIYRLPPPDTLSGNYFGTSVAIDGTRAVIGATGEDACGSNSGAAFVYEIDESGEWVQDARLIPKDCREGYFFGKSVAIEGDRILVSAYRTFVNRSISNAVYVFEMDEEGWKQTARLTSPDNDKTGPFGSSLAMDKDRILITSAGDAAGATMNGVGFIFEQNRRGRWRVAASLVAGLSPRAGVMGTASALDGNRVAMVGSTYSRDRPGVLYVFDFDTEDQTWYQTGAVRGIRDFLISVDVSGENVIVGEGKSGTDGSGRARIFTEVDGIWTTVATLTPSVPYAYGRFGSNVSIDGSVALVSGFDEQLELDINVDQVVYVFTSESGVWTQHRIVDMGQTAFGRAIDVKGGLAVIGQPSESSPGQAYVVRINHP